MLNLERLEDRWVPSTFTVTNTLDDGSTGSLRWAITQANATANVGGPDTIAFNIPGTGVQTISPTSQLPDITDPVIIDGYTQPGSSANTNGPGLGDNAVLQIELNGSQAGSASCGLHVIAGGSTIRGLAINRFSTNGIALATVGGNTISGNFIGTHPTGMIAEGNIQDGIIIGDYSQSSNGNTVGGLTPDARNVISGNGDTGIHIEPANNNTIIGNFIGTDATGKTGLSAPSTFRSGVFIFASNNNTVGGTTASARNIISGNSGGIGNGVEVSGLGTGNQVLGNYIGTDVTGESAVPNVIGVVENAANTVSNNVLSGNTSYGLRLLGGTATGNYIGTDQSGTQALGNQVGVQTAGATLGGTGGAADRNVISGNSNAGVAAGSNSIILGNYIGTDITGTHALGNQAEGILVFNGSNNVTIGGIAHSTANTIANNARSGVRVIAGTGNSILGNSIYNNGGLGILLDSGGNNNQAAPVLTGASSTGSGATVSGTLASAASTSFRIEFFSNSAPNPSGFGDGLTFLGFATVTTDSSGNATFSASLSNSVPVGQRYLSATATNSGTNDTSQFANDLFLPFNFGGFLAPLSNNLSFNQKRTIPIKWQLTDTNGQLITSLSAITSLQAAPVLSSGGLGTPFSLTPSGGTSLRNDGTEYVFNWDTKNVAVGTYQIQLALADGTVQTKTLQIVTKGGSNGLVVSGTSGTTTTIGGLLGGDIDLYVDNTNGDLTADELARVQDALTAANAVTAPYGVAVVEVTDPTLADVTLNMDTTSAVGGYADGVLGCTTDAGQITIINGWNFYAGTDATQIGSTQYDFETVVEHELGHALGLGHSTDSTSVMYAMLNSGEVNRSLKAADLNVPDTDTTGACGLHAAVASNPVSALETGFLASNEKPGFQGRNRVETGSALDLFFALLPKSVSAGALPSTAMFQAQVHDAVFANPSGDLGTAKLAALNAAPVFAAQVMPETTDNPFSDSLLDGTESPVTPSAPATDRPDIRFDFIPADDLSEVDC
jgi:hypothetical protein